jgi:hypothetical protein
MAMGIGMVTGLYASAARSRAETKQSRQHQGVKFYVDMIDRGWNHRFLESVSIFLAMLDQPELIATNRDAQLAACRFRPVGTETR